MSRIILVHGWSGGPDKDWIPWAVEKLKVRGFEVVVPLMPSHDEPKIESWVSKLIEVVGSVRVDDILIGHSIGCQTILRFLQSLPEGQKVDKAIFVAGWFSLKNLEQEDLEIAEPWFKTSIDFDKVRQKVNTFIAIFSDNDPYVSLKENRRVFEHNLKANIIVEHNKWHFDQDHGITDLPILLEIV